MGMMFSKQLSGKSSPHFSLSFLEPDIETQDPPMTGGLSLYGPPVGIQLNLLQHKPVFFSLMMSSVFCRVFTGQPCLSCEGIPIQPILFSRGLC